MRFNLKQPTRHRAALVDLTGDTGGLLEEMLRDRGVVTVATYTGLAELAEVRTLGWDVLVMHVTDASGALAAALTGVCAAFRKPTLVIACGVDEDGVARLIEAGADAVLPVGVGIDRLALAMASALASFERVDGYRAGAEQARDALEARKLVERAKSILMQQRGIAEPDAMKHLQATSMRRNEPIVAIARSVIAAKELLG